MTRDAMPALWCEWGYSAQGNTGPSYIAHEFHRSVCRRTFLWWTKPPSPKCANKNEKARFHRLGNNSVNVDCFLPL